YPISTSRHRSRHGPKPAQTRSRAPCTPKLRSILKPGRGYRTCRSAAAAPADRRRWSMDIPISKITAGLPYDFGISAVSHGTNAGALRITLNQVNSSGKVLQLNAVTATIPTGFRSYTDANSVYRAATFTGNTTAPLAIASGATAIRFAISPQTSNMTFDVLDAWVMPRGQQ